MGKKRRKRKQRKRAGRRPSESAPTTGQPGQGGRKSNRRREPDPPAANSTTRESAGQPDEEIEAPAESTRTQKVETPPPDAVGRLAVVSVLFLALPLFPHQPLAFLPPVLYWPVYLAALAGWWLHEARRQGWRALPRPVSDHALEIVGLSLVLGAFVLLKVIGIHPSGTDENIYYYMAVRMTHGELPYRDFFFAHPPVHLLVPALIFSVTGFSVQVAKSIPIAAQLAAAVCLYLALRRTSKGLALLSILLMLTAYQLLMGSTDMNGENLMTAFLMAALLAGVSRRYVLSGVLAGLALGSGLYALAAVVALAVAAAFTSRRAGARFGLGVLGGFVGVCLPFAIIGGAGFFKGVFAYHFAKPSRSIDHIPVFGSPNPFAMLGALVHDVPVYLASKRFKETLYFQAPGYLAAALAGVLLLGRGAWARSRPGRVDEHGERWQDILTPRDLLSGAAPGFAKLGLLATLLFLVQWSALPEFYDFYAVPMLALMALPGAWVLYEVYAGVRDARAWEDLAVPSVLVVAFSLHGPWAASLLRQLWPGEVQEKGQIVSYEWHKPWVPAWLAAPARRLFFVDHRVRGEVMPYYRHYVWNKGLTFSTVDDIARYVQNHSHAGETITGASDLAPLVALRAHRRMAAGVVDTNSKRFVSGELTEADLFRRICHDKVRFIVSAPGSFFSPRFMQSDAVIRRFFVPDREFRDPELIHFRPFPIVLYRRVDRPGLSDGEVCSATP